MNDFSESTASANKQVNATPVVGLFVTCLANMMRPSIGFAAVKLLQQAGCEVVVPSSQVCCGQPGSNSGDMAAARAIAQQVIATFEAFDYVVGPSGSCLATLRDYAEWLKDDPLWAQRAQNFSSRCWELTSFLVDVRKIQRVETTCSAVATYHDSCSGLRELSIKQQPRALLTSVQGLELQEMNDSEVCCGFGGTFCIKYPAISERIVDAKLENINATRATMLVGGDLGCLLNMAGRLTRCGKKIKVFHVAEVLAGMTDVPAIGEGAGAGGQDAN